MKNYILILVAVSTLLTGCQELLVATDETGCDNYCIDDQVMIIGCDDRVLIPDEPEIWTEKPWNFIGKFDPVGCTGTLIGDRWVLTAAHCFYEFSARTQLGFALAQTHQPSEPGGIGGGPSQQNGPARPYGTHGVKSIYLPLQYDQTGEEEDRAYDYALIELWEPVPNVVPANYGTLDGNQLRTRPVYSAGYPGSEPDGSALGRPWIADGEYQDNQPFLSVGSGEAGLLYSNLDGSDGQSGSPVYAFLNSSEHSGSGFIRMVHGVLVGSPLQNCEMGQNWVAFLTADAVEQIENAMAPNAIDLFWEKIDLPDSPTVGQGETWP